MYYLAKLAQAAGLAVIGTGLLTVFPKLINAKVLSAGILLFLLGWIVENFLLKR